jgi:hemolysin activation/secretion protein
LISSSLGAPVKYSPTPAPTPPPTVTGAAETLERNDAPAAPAGQDAQSGGSMYVREYRVTGAKLLKGVEVEEAVYPFLGPGRTTEDVEAAAAALEKAYHDKGYQTVSVEVPSQSGRKGIIILQVTENKVGRLRVHGSRYFSLAQIKKHAPSMAEGTVPNFNDVTRDIVALNKWSDRRVTPELKPGVEPGTVDIDLTVKDTFPLHGTLELNNRYSADTTELRLSGGLSYSNLWQRGHTIGANFQIAPERSTDAKIFSGYYIWRFEDLPDLSLSFHGRKQDSNVATLGGVNVVSPGYSLGASATLNLPGAQNYFHSFTFGMDYNQFEENVVVGLQTTQKPIVYYPITAAYNATLIGKKSLTTLDASVNFHLRGMGSSQSEFERKRLDADGSYIYFRGDLSHTQDLPLGAQLFGKVQGQLAGSPLVNSEQYAGGGLNTARGYLEAAALGDYGVFGTAEFRTPSLLSWVKKEEFEWRFYTFLDAGFLKVIDPGAEEKARFEFASYGFGSRIRLFDYLNGSLDVGIPLKTLALTEAGDTLLTFRVWADF